MTYSIEQRLADHEEMIRFQADRITELTKEIFVLYLVVILVAFGPLVTSAVRALQ